MSKSIKGVLAFENGTVFRGFSIGAQGTVVGEIVFNTSMTGYQEILTDPSYAGQIITFTAPQIGNYGINKEDNESNKPQPSAIIVRELCKIPSNWRSTGTLQEYLVKNSIPGIENVDTRAITKMVRDAGVLKVCLSTEDISDEEAIQKAKDWKGLEGIDLVKENTCKAPYTFKRTISSYQPEGMSFYQKTQEKEVKQRYSIVAFDFGAKRNILELLSKHGFDVTVVPATTSAEAVRAMNPDGIFLSNGPGDPSALTYAHKTVSKLLNDYPIFGICMGHQIITHALGAKTYKLRFGHRGGNQPVKNIESGCVSISVQNHGYASHEESLKGTEAIVTEINLNDNTVAGLRHKTLPIFSVQYHPEASPGPHDAEILFEHFYNIVSKAKSG